MNWGGIALIFGMAALVCFMLAIWIGDDDV
jgi:hypothetical protein